MVVISIDMYPSAQALPNSSQKLLIAYSERTWERTRHILKNESIQPKLLLHPMPKWLAILC
jgi:hypothetical protein